MTMHRASSSGQYTLVGHGNHTNGGRLLTPSSSFPSYTNGGVWERAGLMARETGSAVTQPAATLSREGDS